jgi:NAD(P)-dependent dehydrogenase (short-subunit alcohol dehydrogenase family)
MDLGIAGRKAIVCASSKGLGRACAESLAEAGCEVVINGRNRDVLEATAAELRKAPTSRPRRDRPRCSPPVRNPTFSSTTMPGRRSAISASSPARRSSTV